MFLLKKRKENKQHLLLQYFYHKINQKGGTIYEKDVNEADGVCITF